MCNRWSTVCIFTIKSIGEKRNYQLDQIEMKRKKKQTNEKWDERKKQEECLVGLSFACSNRSREPLTDIYTSFINYVSKEKLGIFGISNP